MREGTMTGIISVTEAMRIGALRLEAYRLAVQAGFYNEGEGTVAYKGYQIISDEGRYLVFKHGQCLTRMVDLQVAKVWITCRVHNLTLTEALAVVRAEVIISA